MKVAMPSEIGMLSQTPSVSKCAGRIKRSGRRNSSWREAERKMAHCALPMDWKKLATTICIPTIGKTATTMRIPLAEILINSWSSVNSWAICVGNNSPNRKAPEVTMVA